MDINSIENKEDRTPQAQGGDFVNNFYLAMGYLPAQCVAKHCLHHDNHCSTTSVAAFIGRSSYRLWRRSVLKKA